MNESKDNFDGFLGPSAHGFSELSGLSCSSDPSIVFGVGDASFVSEYILEILFGFGKVHSFDGFGGFVGVFIMCANIFSGGFGDFVGIGVSGVNSFSHSQ